MEILLGGISSLFYGVADFLGGEGAKRAPAASIVMWSGVFSLPLIAVVAVIVGGRRTSPDLLIGALAGACGAVGLVLLFAGLARGQAAAVAPIAAATSAVLPVVVAILEGERPTLVVWLGVLLAVLAIMLCAWVVDPGDVPGGGFLYGLAAGLGFGGFTIVIRLTSPESSLWPLVSSRASTLVVVLIVGLLGLWKITGLPSVPKAIVIGNGFLDVSANVTLLLALRAGSLALAAVAASFYPAITVLMARVVNAEHLHMRQLAGLGLAVVALAAIAVG